MTDKASGAKRTPVMGPGASHHLFVGDQKDGAPDGVCATAVRYDGVFQCWERRQGGGGVDMETFRFTGFYGNPEMRLCRHSWDLLRRIAGSVQGPWIVGGDFNEILEAHEYFGRHFRPMSQMRAFREALEECGLTTIRFQGYKFTWSNRCQGG
ncbi:unnamed protein product [Prunus armeniaca]|uniref:Endonuclease/exonuclease/phosphatase domain-containing protein n=1 Tax=Prunus armeniaca TaxID=36596 RepID=A0A6J5USR3_PRUAR|nr:unnamed protein product [Prunus armeniaca]